MILQYLNPSTFFQLQMEDELKANIEKFEKEKKRLEMLVKSDEVKQELETQLASLKEESDAKMLKVHEWKIKIQEYKTRLVHFQRYHKELQVLTEKNEQIQKARQGNPSFSLHLHFRQFLSINKIIKLGCYYIFIQL